MIDNNLGYYISVISHNSITLVDNYVGDGDDKLIYKFIASLEDKNKTRLSNKIVKKIINKMRLINEIVRKKTDKNVYIAKQYRTGDLFVIEYIQGGLKDRFKNED